jgi:hypothetical protein
MRSCPRRERSLAVHRVRAPRVLEPRTTLGLCLQVGARSVGLVVRGYVAAGLVARVLAICGCGATTTGSSGSKCDPNYQGACLDPNASDYDCAGGSGNGPRYVQGPIRVVGNDHFGLDRDGDGIACESAVMACAPVRRERLLQNACRVRAS